MIDYYAYKLVSINNFFNYKLSNYLFIVVLLLKFVLKLFLSWEQSIFFIFSSLKYEVNFYNDVELFMFYYLSLLWYCWKLKELKLFNLISLLG